MEAILSNKQYRNLFYMCVVAILLVLASLRYFVLPALSPYMSAKCASFLAQLAGECTTSLVVTVWIGAFLFYVTPKAIREAKIEAIDAKSINRLLKGATAKSTEWTLRGAMGRFTRAETLPKMIEQARDSGVRRKLRLIILYPDNVKACRTYANYRNGVASASKSLLYTEESVRFQILATILTACKASLTESMIDIQIHLVPIWSAIRIDLSHEYAILTSEDPRDPGLRVDRESHFYGVYTKELDLVAQQGRLLLRLDPSSDLRITDPTDVTTVLNKLDIKLDDLTPERCAEIFKLVNSKDHQYA
jgi:hypothetical protein